MGCSIVYMPRKAGETPNKVREAPQIKLGLPNKASLRAPKGLNPALAAGYGFCLDF